MKLFIFGLFLSFNVYSNIEHFSINSNRSLYIIDGDSVSLQMRIAGIDTPEIKQKCRKSANQILADLWLSQVWRFHTKIHIVKKKNLPRGKSSDFGALTLHQSSRINGES